MRRALLALVILAAGCGVSTREARAIQPNPARQRHTVEDIPASVKLYIHQRDMHLSRDYQLRSFAQFVVVSREKLRFHVGITRWDEREAETKGWKVYLEDEAGNRLEPVSREVARLSRISVGWELYPYQPGGDGWCREPPCLQRLMPPFEVYEGEADYVFSRPDILAPDRKLLRLVMTKGGLEFIYSWRFDDQMVVEHYGRSRLDNELGTIVVPGPNTEVAGTRYESENW